MNELSTYGPDSAQDQLLRANSIRRTPAMRLHFFAEVAYAGNFHLYRNSDLDTRRSRMLCFCHGVSSTATCPQARSETKKTDSPLHIVHLPYPCLLPCPPCSPGVPSATRREGRQAGAPVPPPSRCLDSDRLRSVLRWPLCKQSMARPLVPHAPLGNNGAVQKRLMCARTGVLSFPLAAWSLREGSMNIVGGEVLFECRESVCNAFFRCGLQLAQAMGCQRQREKGAWKRG